MTHPSLLSRRLFAASAMLVFVAALVPVSALAATGTTRWVNDDKPIAAAPGKNCDKPGYSTIQAAINASVAGDTVRVCAGTYAGAVVDRAVKLDGDHAVITSGPYSHPGLFQAGFLFNVDRSGSGASIKGFDIVGAAQYGADDGKIDFGIFSRGADNVTVEHNDFSMLLQGITDWNGTGWDIEHNNLEDLWTRCGGGIGILVGGFDGLTSVLNNRVAHNDLSGTVFVSPTDCGGYSAVGLTMYSDSRYGRPGALEITGNNIDHNKVDLVSSDPETVPVDGIEITDTNGDDGDPAVPGNVISHNEVRGETSIGVWSSAGTSGNEFSHNKVSGSYDNSCVDESAGAGTAGTANLWDHNKGNIASDPAAICD